MDDKKDMVPTSVDYCKNCRWSNKSGGLVCNYYLATNKHRECPVGYCDKKEVLGKERGYVWIDEMYKNEFNRTIKYRDKNYKEI